MSSIRFISAAFLSIGLLNAANAAVVVSWGTLDTTNAPVTDIVSANVNITPKDSESISFTGFTNPSVGANYYPNNTGKTPRYYGAAHLYANSTISGLGTWRIDDNATSDRFLMSNNSTPSGGQVNAAWIFPKSRFLSNGVTNNVTLTKMSALVDDNGSATNTSVYFIIQLSGTNYYVSNAFGEGNSSLTDPTAATWRSYAPGTSFRDLSGSVAALTSTDFENLTAAGVFVQGVGSGTVQTRLNGFEVEGTVVPEPASLSLLAPVAGLLLGRRRGR